MFVRRALTFSLVTFLLVAAQPVSFGANSPRPIAVADLEEQLFAAINHERAANGLPALKRAENLNHIAQSHSQDMLVRNYFDHRTPEGLSLKDRVERGQVNNWRRIAENIASSRSCTRFDAVKLTIQGWMNSPGHRQNILDKQMQETGIGIATDPDGKTYYVTQVFIARR